MPWDEIFEQSKDRMKEGLSWNRLSSRVARLVDIRVFRDLGECCDEEEMEEWL